MTTISGQNHEPLSLLGNRKKMTCKPEEEEDEQSAREDRLAAMAQAHENKRTNQKVLDRGYFIK